MNENLDSLDPLVGQKIEISNEIARSAYAMYDAKAMSGLPVGVQIVGQRLEEEKVLEGMKLIQIALKAKQVVFHSLDV